MITVRSLHEAVVSTYGCVEKFDAWINSQGATRVRRSCLIGATDVNKHAGVNTREMMV